MLIMIATLALLVALGILFYSGRGLFLLAGYNTLPRKEQEAYDQQALGKAAGLMMFALSFSMLLWVLGDALQLGWLFTIGLVLFVGIVFFAVFYSNTGNRFKKSSR